VDEADLNGISISDRSGISNAKIGF